MNFYKTKRWKATREKVLRRDGYECKECRRYGRNRIAACVHHVNPLLEHPEWRIQMWNLISLCNSCHDKMHDRENDVLTELGEYWRNKVTPPQFKK
ncbi:HNH endonuclease [Caryophanon tenue]|uniref:HNH endonuclease n=1 Tax=Caryophanon tenue TaxID=33978 RepID=UPI000A06F5C4|nr:HNH endonuclease [Caryophanon tenue]